jgi:pyruvate dehydrogenase (quinone)
MARKKVADLLVDVLAEAGGRQIYGISGDSLNGITDSIRARKQTQWIHVRHEETAAFAAGAEAHLTGYLAAAPEAAVPVTCI